MVKCTGSSLDYGADTPVREREGGREGKRRREEKGSEREGGRKRA